ncbi:MAG: hypothetical protein QNJ51_27920 [Calothrix sp. MO_167.B12]|nr:hypothetical protein [Calothrix sp. MO_167.B12]
MNNCSTLFRLYRAGRVTLRVRQSLYAGEPVHRADSPLLILVVIFVLTIHDGAELPGNSNCALPPV